MERDAKGNIVMFGEIIDTLAFTALAAKNSFLKGDQHTV